MPVIAAPIITPGVAASRLFVDVSRLPFQLTFLVFCSSNILQVGQTRSREQWDVMDAAVARGLSSTGKGEAVASSGTAEVAAAEASKSHSA